MRGFAAVLAASALAACATVPPGEDARGAELKERSTPVLQALNAYHRDRGRYPASLYELVPRYLKEVPFGYILNLDNEKQVLEFIYMLPFPRTGNAACAAALGTEDWTCRAQ